MSRLKSVVQTTSETTAVTVNAFNGRITTVELDTAASGTFNFTVNNAKIKANSNVQLTPIYAGAGIPDVRLASQTDGSFVVTVTNLDAADAFDAALSINFGMV